MEPESDLNFATKDDAEPEYGSHPLYPGGKVNPTTTITDSSIPKSSMSSIQ